MTTTKTDLSSVIEKKENAAEYMCEEIAHICKTFGKRDPGSKGEEEACLYMEKVLKEDCGCEETRLEHFSLHPGSFYGWIYITISLVLLSFVLYFFIPWISVILTVAGLVVAFLQFGLYKKSVDFLFPKKQSCNLTAVKKSAGETKRRIVYNGHLDAAWEWPVNYKLGGAWFEAHALICALGAVYLIVISALKNSISPKNAMIMGLMCLVFVPFWIGLYFMWNERKIVDGANDDLSGCYMGISLLKALKDENINLENTEIVVLLTGSEEAGLRGAKAWCEKHADEYNDVPTYIYSYDTIHDPKQLMVNYRDLNGTVKADKDASDLFIEAADELNVFCKKGMVPPLGGATDSAAFAMAGMKSTGITALNHKLENYYHTRRDTYDNMNTRGLADCFAVTVKVLEKFDTEVNNE